MARSETNLTKTQKGKKEDTNDGPTRLLAREIMNLADNCSRNGMLSVTEMRAHLDGTPHADFAKWFTHRKVFFKFDLDKSGAISFDELVEVPLPTLCCWVSHCHAQAIRMYLSGVSPSCLDHGVARPASGTRANEANASSLRGTFETLQSVVDGVVPEQEPKLYKSAGAEQQQSQNWRRNSFRADRRGSQDRGRHHGGQRRGSFDEGILIEEDDTIEFVPRPPLGGALCSMFYSFGVLSPHDLLVVTGRFGQEEIRRHRNLRHRHVKIPLVPRLDMSRRHHGFEDATQCWDQHLKIAKQRQGVRNAVNEKPVEMWWPWWDAKHGTPQTYRSHIQGSPHRNGSTNFSMGSGAYTTRASLMAPPVLPRFPRSMPHPPGARASYNSAQAFVQGHKGTDGFWHTGRKLERVIRGRNDPTVLHCTVVQPYSIHTLYEN